MTGETIVASVCSRFQTSAGLSEGFACSNRATTPETTAAEKDVPDFAVGRVRRQLEHLMCADWRLWAGAQMSTIAP